MSGSAVKGESYEEGVCCDMGGKYCVVGAGPAGLSVSRAFDRLGIPHDVIERFADVGGIWDIDNPGTPMYRSAHFISSKFTSNFFGYPMPDNFPDYPNHEQILEYIRAFAQAYDLNRNITFNTEVRYCEETDDGSWLVTLDSGEVRKYRGLICCNGVTWHKSMPELPGNFNGEIIHSRDYFGTDQFEGKRVLLIGMGNSGADIACDAAQTAKSAIVSVRRGYHFIPKFVFGIPVDVYHHHLSEMPSWMQEPDLATIIGTITGDTSRLGLPKPDHEPFESHPLLNTQLLHHLGHGDISVKPDVAKLDGEFVEFKDGSREAFDLIVCATGYRHEIPYVPEEYFDWSGGRPELYMNTFSPNHPRLFALGFFEVASAAYQLFDRVSGLIAQNILDMSGDDEKADMFSRLKQEDDFDLRGGATYIDSDRHANYIDYDTFGKHISWICSEMGWDEVGPETFRSADDRATPVPIIDALGL